MLVYRNGSQNHINDRIDTRDERHLGRFKYVVGIAWFYTMDRCGTVLIGGTGSNGFQTRCVRFRSNWVYSVETTSKPVRPRETQIGGMFFAY